MFYTKRGRGLVYLFSLLLGIGLCAVCVSVKEAHDDVGQCTDAAAMSEMTILIDAGHGGFDGGATANGISEKDINLSVAKKLRERIEGGGGRAVMTREEDVSTADEERTDGSSAKKSDLKRRREMIKESGANMFISIHMNKFPQEQYWGAQVFYSKTPEESRRLGEAIQAALPRVLIDGNTRVAKAADSGIYILKNTEIPAAIVECGFISNPEEAERLKTEEYQSKLADAIYEGICDFLNSTA